jgi:hypothetical protein
MQPHLMMFAKFLPRHSRNLVFRGPDSPGAVPPNIKFVSVPACQTAMGAHRMGMPVTADQSVHGAIS